MARLDSLANAIDHRCGETSGRMHRQIHGDDRRPADRAVRQRPREVSTHSVSTPARRSQAAGEASQMAAGRGRRWRPEELARLSLFHVILQAADEPAPTTVVDARAMNTPAERVRTHRLFRPSARPLHPVLQRDVGALQLLRDARFLILYDGGCHGRRHGPRHRDGRGDLRHLHVARLSDERPGGWLPIACSDSARRCCTAAS